MPAEWVATPAGKFAHSIKIPNPLPKDSGYRTLMSSEDYFKLLCEREAGEFIFKTVNGVDGFYFARPPNRPTDDDLQDRYKLEAPEIERTFQLLRATSAERAAMFVNPPWSQYVYIEEPAPKQTTFPFVRMSGYRQKVSPMTSQPAAQLISKYGLIWRGIKRQHDRELAIAGSEWIVIDLRTNEVLAVQRNFARTGLTRNTPGGIWWLNASSCRKVGPPDNLSGRFYNFVTKALLPVAEPSK